MLQIKRKTHLRSSIKFGKQICNHFWNGNLHIFALTRLWNLYLDLFAVLNGFSMKRLLCYSTKLRNHVSLLFDMFLRLLEIVRNNKNYTTKYTMRYKNVSHAVSQATCVEPQKQSWTEILLLLYDVEIWRILKKHRLTKEKTTSK